MYDVILADPPWPYRNWGAPSGKTHMRTRGAAKHYPLMRLHEIMSIPVWEVVERAALFMWVTWPFLQAGLDVMRAWGFTHKTTAWVWVKTTRIGLPRMGMGYYARHCTEPCLLGFRGRPTRPLTRNILGLITAPPGRHSRKPSIQYELIERLYPGGRKLELFATEGHPGWDTWGNAVPNSPGTEALSVGLP